MDNHPIQYEPLRSPEAALKPATPNQPTRVMALGSLFFAQLAAITALNPLFGAAAQDLRGFVSENPTNSIGASLGYFTGSFFVGKLLSDFLWEYLRGAFGEKVSLNASSSSMILVLLISGYAKDHSWYCALLFLLGLSSGLLRPGLAGINWVEIDQKDKILNYLYIFTGTGALAGPFIGSQLYSLFETNKLFKTTICISGLMLATLLYFNLTFNDPETSTQRDFKSTDPSSAPAQTAQTHLKAYTSAFLSHSKTLLTFSSLKQNKPRLLLYLACGIVWSVKVLDWLLLPLWIVQIRQKGGLVDGISGIGPQISVLEGQIWSGVWIQPKWVWGLTFMVTAVVIGIVFLAEMKWGRVFGFQLKQNAQLHIASVSLIALITGLPWACTRVSDPRRLGILLAAGSALKDTFFVFWICNWSRSFPRLIPDNDRENSLAWGLLVGHLLLIGLSQVYPRLLSTLVSHQLAEKYLGSLSFVFLHATLALLLIPATLILRAIPFSQVGSVGGSAIPDEEVSVVYEPSVDVSVSQIISTEDETKWGQNPRVIKDLSLQYQTFGQSVLEGRTEFAHKHIVVQNSPWREKHIGMPGQFSDPDFGVLTSSLVGWGALEKPGDQEKLNKMLHYSFARPPATENWDLIGDGVSCNDVFQGELGDCYFLSALSAAALHPHRILRLMMQRGKSLKSAYCAAFCITGVWVEVVVDDKFPIRQDGVYPFCRADAKKFWPMILEKAYAKLYGGYWHIGAGGQSLEALRDITGAPTEQISLKDEKEEATAFQRLKEAHTKRYIVTLGSKGEGEVKSDNGVIMGHGYALLAVISLSNGQKLLKLRNPWGKSEWTGDWGDKSTKWTPELKREAGWTDKDDGIFFITYPDFKENFDTISIARCHDSYCYSYLKTKAADQEPELMQFTIAETGEYYVGVSQKSKFFYPSLANFEYRFLSAVILKREEDGSFTYIDEFGSQRRDPWVKLQLQPGTYWALVYANWIFSNEMDYTFWTYGEKNTVIKKVVDQPSRIRMTQVLADVFTRMAKADEAEWEGIFLDPATQIPRCRHKYVKGKHAYGYYIFENRATQNQVLRATLTKSGQGVWLIHPQAGVTGANLVINPGESKIVIYRIQKGSYQVQFPTSYQFG